MNCQSNFGVCEVEFSTEVDLFTLWWNGCKDIPQKRCNDFHSWLSKPELEIRFSREFRNAFMQETCVNEMGVALENAREYVFKLIPSFYVSFFDDSELTVTLHVNNQKLYPTVPNGDG